MYVFKDVIHTCPQCNTKIAKYNRFCCCFKRNNGPKGTKHVEQSIRNRSFSQSSASSLGNDIMDNNNENTADASKDSESSNNEMKNIGPLVHETLLKNNNTKGTRKKSKKLSFGRKSSKTDVK